MWIGGSSKIARTAEEEFCLRPPVWFRLCRLRRCAMKSLQTTMHSWAKPTKVRCPTCGEVYEFDAWVIVDMDERPDLVERISNPSFRNPLHRPTCYACGTWGFLLDEPLLLYRPGKAPPLLFSPADGATADEIWNQAVNLFNRLRASLGNTWRPEWNDQMALVERQLLPAVLAHGLEAVVQQTADAGPRAASTLDEPGATAEIFQEEPNTVNDGSAAWVRDQIDLGIELKARFDSSGQVSDLDAALGAFERVLNATTRGSANWVRCRIQQGHTLRMRFEILKQCVDLDGAITAYEQALDGTEEGSTGRTVAKAGLAIALIRRFDLHPEKADLDFAIDNLQQAITEVEEDSSDWASYQNNLGVALLSRFNADHETSDLDAAINAFKRVLSLAEYRSADWGHRQVALGEALFRRSQVLGQDEDLTDAIASYERALEGFRPRDSPAACFNVANRLGYVRFNRREWRKAAAALIRAVQAMNTIYRSQASDGHRDAWLGRAISTYHLAAYALARVGHLRAAAVILEQGRARSMSQIEVRDDEAALADPTWADIVRAVMGGNNPPLAYITTTSAGSLAIVLHQPSENLEGSAVSIDALWLNGLADRDLSELLVGPSVNGEVQAGWFGAYDQWHKNPEENLHAWLDAVELCTRRLWEGFMEPVVMHIRFLGWKRAVLIPSEVLGLLPLHAAWTESPGLVTCEGNDTRFFHRFFRGKLHRQRLYALDQVAFSYTPSARLLTRARHIAQAVLGDCLLAIDEPRPVAQVNPLANSGIEVKAIASLFHSPQILRHEQANRSRLLEELPKAAIVHFACHGVTNWEEPLESGMLMSSNVLLTVRDIVELNLDGARLATLSACETGIIGLRLPDEVVGLPSAFIRAGFAGVLSSLWAVDDQSTAMLMQRFYTSWRTKGMTPALALQEAQQWLRSSRERDSTTFRIQQLPAPIRHIFYTMETLQFVASCFVRRIIGGRTEAPFEHPYWWAAFYLAGD
jgi:tetratricopeptide (TPR) repeat protein